MEIKAFCKDVSGKASSGIISRKQAKTIIGQAKSGDLDAAMRGLLRLTVRQEEQCDQCQSLS